MITVSDIVRVLPANLKSSATDDLADKLNNITNDPHHLEAIKDNFMSYTGVLNEGRWLWKASDVLRPWHWLC